MEQTTSFDAYKQKFKQYAARFDASDGRIALKIVHTDAVVTIMDRLCTLRALPEHTRQLALLCALFHDIGRFEQLCQYNTFLDHKSVDHAALGCQVLKEQEMLKELPESDQKKILTAISNHNRLEIEESAASDEECLTLCRLLRDADKCDIFRVFATDDMKDVIGVPDEAVTGETISPEVLAAIREHRCVDKRIRKTYLDFWVSFLGFFFDLNYPESIVIAKNQGYYRMPFDRVIFTNPEGKKQVEEVLEIMETYLRNFSQESAGTSLSLRVPEQLQEFFRLHPKMALAFSGGTDSAYLLYAAQTCGCQVRAYYVSTSFQPEFELEDARRLALELGADIKILTLDVLQQDSVRANPKDRCYYCKNAIFHEILSAAASDGFTEIMDGTNASDDADDRPGMRALKELKVLSPLRLCGVTKKALREYSRNAGLFTWNKPAYACLATRIPAGTAIDSAILSDVEWAETELSRLGFFDFRVRVRKEDETETSTSWSARLQITEAQLPLLLEKRSVLLSLLKTRFDSVSLDLELRAPSC